MTPAYKERLLALSEELKQLSDEWINVGDGSDACSQTHTDQEMLLHSKISHLVGFISALNEL